MKQPDLEPLTIGGRTVHRLPMEGTQYTLYRVIWNRHPVLELISIPTEHDVRSAIEAAHVARAAARAAATPVRRGNYTGAARTRRGAP